MLKSLHSQWFLVHEGCHQALQVFRYKHACHLSHVQKLPCQAVVPISVAAIYCVGQYGLIIFANDFIHDTLSTSFGLATIPPLRSTKWQTSSSTLPSHSSGKSKNFCRCY